jgi:hypothetical protein
MSRIANDSNGQELGQIVGRFGQNSYLAPEHETAAVSHVFGPDVRLVRVAVENSAAKHVHFRVGVDPTASLVDDPFLPVNHVEYFAVKPGEQISFVHAQNQAVKICVTDII